MFVVEAKGIHREVQGPEVKPSQKNETNIPFSVKGFSVGWQG